MFLGEFVVVGQRMPY